MAQVQITKLETTAEDFAAVQPRDIIAVHVCVCEVYHKGEVGAVVYRGEAFDVFKEISKANSYNSFGDFATFEEFFEVEDLASIKSMYETIDELNGDGCDFIIMTLVK